MDLVGIHIVYWIVYFKEGYETQAHAYLIPSHPCFLKLTVFFKMTYPLFPLLERKLFSCQ
jgi:hypothetical protein